MFAGLISKEQGVSAWGDPVQIISALAPYSLDKPRDVWATDRQLLLQVATRTGSSTAEIYRHPESGVGVAFWGRLDNRPDLIAQLDVEHKAADDELIALAWLKWGEFCPEKLIGDFAFAVASPKTGAVFLARDVMGVKPLYYRADQHGIFFANSAAAFKPLKLGTLTRSQEWMARYMLDISQSHTDTAYEEIKKLASAHSLLIHADGRMNIRRYHQFVDDAPNENKRDPKYLEAYRAVWQEAVACRMPTSGNIGTENSGGLDSGSITAEIARQLGADIDRLFGMGFCFEELEPEYIMATAMKYKMKNTNIFSNEESVHWNDIRKHEYNVNGYPQEHSDGSWHFPFYELCKLQDVNVLYSGFGGDEVVTNPAVSQIRMELLDQKNLYGLWQVLPGAIPMKVARFIKTVLKSKSMPIFSPYLMDAYKERWIYQIINDQMLLQFDLENEYFASATYDERFRKINDSAIYLLSTPYASTRLENCTLMASSYGVDYVWPLWDQRLVQQWLSTPTIWKLGDGEINRFLHRSAVDKVCAEKVVWKPNKDMGYAKTKSLAEGESNIAILQKIVELIADAPKIVELIIDVKKARHLAECGIRENWKGAQINFALNHNANKLQNLICWLK